RVLDAFGQGMKDGWGAGPAGLSPQTERALRDHGVFNDYTSGRTSILKSFNEVMIRPAAVPLDDAIRGTNSVLSGLAAATGQALDDSGSTQELGNDPSRTRSEFEGMAQLMPAALGVANELGIVGKPGIKAPEVERPTVEPPTTLAMATSEGIPPARALYAEP